jgi:hypothetical protein
MKAFLLLFLCAAMPAIAQNYTFTTPHLTMHVGDPVPPCSILAINQTTGKGVGDGSTLFNGSPATCAVGATSSSPVGTYPITVSLGDMTAKSGGTITVENGSIQVIPVDANGAQLKKTSPYPSGFTSGPNFSMINVTSNSICNMVHDNGTTDNTACMQNLLTLGGLRAHAGALVSTSGTTVTGNQNVAYDNMNFTNIPAGTTVKINGTSYTVASVTSSSALTLTTSAPTLTNVLMSVPTTVNTSGMTVTATNGVSFTGLTGNVLINGVIYTISSVTDATHLTTTATLPTQTGVAFYQADLSSNSSSYGRSTLYLYFPAGIYWIKGTVFVYRNYWTMIGDGAQQTTIKLAPNLAAFNQGTTLVPMIDVPAISGSENFSEIFENMGLEVGQGDPNAIAIQWPNNNMGSIENAQFWSADSNASVGISLGENYAGPTLLKNVAIYGFQTGISATSPASEYSMTADQITMEGQETQGCLCNMTASFQHVLSDNAAYAWNTTTQGRGVLIDSELLSTDPVDTGISIASGNQLYFKNVSCTGYTTCETDNGVNRVTLPSEGWTGAAQTIFDSGSTPASLNISDTETPVAVDPASSTWTMLGSDPTTWCATIAGSTSTTVYLPPGTYVSSATSVSCDIPDTVNHILMYDSKFSTFTTTLVTFSVTGTSTTPLVIEGCMHGACVINHTGTRTLAMRDYNGGYVTASGAGNVYFEDVETFGDAPSGKAQNGPTFYSGQLMTARQLDIETGDSDGISYPKIQCQGANVWILGYKTENNSPSIIETAKCQANLFGFWFYNLQTAQAGVAPMELTDSSLFATGFDDWNTAGDGSPYWVTESRSGVNGYLDMPGYQNAFGEALNMFYSYGASPPQ